MNYDKTYTSYEAKSSDEKKITYVALSEIRSRTTT